MVGCCKIVNATSFVPQSTTYVFSVALPCLVLNSLGIQIDFYSEAFLWDFIVAFLILRVLALVVAGVIVVARDPRRNNKANNNRGGMGQIAVLWLALTWISTVILGVPIASAVFDDPTKGTSRRAYNIVYYDLCEHCAMNREGSF
jgi:predicted permease